MLCPQQLLQLGKDHLEQNQATDYTRETSTMTTCIVAEAAEAAMKPMKVI